MNLAQIKKLYAKKDTAHNWKHILRLRRNAKRIIESDKLKMNKNTLKFLIHYHGLKDYVKRNRTRLSLEQRRSLFRHSNRSITIEEKIVHDANMLDNVGIQGIEKALFVGKGIGRDKENTFKYLKKEIKKIKFYTREGKRLGREEIRIMKKAIEDFT